MFFLKKKTFYDIIFSGVTVMQQSDKNCVLIIKHHIFYQTNQRPVNRIGSLWVDLVLVLKFM